MSETERFTPQEANTFSAEEQKEKTGFGKAAQRAMRGQGWLERPEVARSPESMPDKKAGLDNPPGTSPTTADLSAGSGSGSDDTHGATGDTDTKGSQPADSDLEGGAGSGTGGTPTDGS